MRITFGPAKREATLLTRGLDFAEADLVFAGPVFEVEDTRFDYGEKRMMTFGLLRGRMVAIVWTGNEDERRVISLRKCNAREVHGYRQRLG